MPAMGVYDQIKKAFQDLIAPELHALRADLQRLEAKIDGVDQRLTMRIEALEQVVNAKLAALGHDLEGVDTRLSIKLDGLRAEIASNRAELLSEIRRVDIRIDAVDTRLESLERTVTMAIDVRERLAALEARRSP
jgi:chromosome segregation ATPase